MTQQGNGVQWVDVLVVGGGPAGLAAAVELHKQGIRNMIILEREAMLGGILRQLGVDCLRLAAGERDSD